MKYFLVVYTLLLLSGCSFKNYTHTTAKLITLKTPKIKFSDIAYIRHNDNALELELFVAGQVINRLSIDNLVCVQNQGCMSKSSFNAKYLEKSYPPNILQNILLGDTIYNGKNKKQTANGFEQIINTQNVALIYRVTRSQIYFKDKKNHILIKIKELKQ